jgi:CRISPR/Cas system endoribonuclease Cas6 (RAMP superfamily)
MNERIRELAEQATTYIEPTSNSGEGWIFDKEKFAELIVQECISKYDEWAEHSTDKTSFAMARHNVKKYLEI